MRQKLFNKQLKRKNYYFWLVLSCWTILIVVIILFSGKQALYDYQEEAKSQARAAYFRDLAYRAWCSSHGGVYVPITEKVQPNPYLVHPERDVVTTNGKALTLVNPAWMTSAAHKIHKSEDLLQSRIISDCPINPDNSCDEWDQKAMSKLFEGAKEFSEVTNVDGVPYVRLIRPLYTDQNCLKCHEHQGYKLGDIRGGISISRPVDDLLARKYTAIKTETAGYLVIWLIGVLGILYGWQKTLQSLSAREKTIQTLRKAKLAAEDANKSKTQFLANMSHEIRTPMTAILGFSDLLYYNEEEETDNTPKSQHNRYVGIIRNNARLLLDIINDLLDMTKVESGKVQLELIPVSPIQSCEEVTSLMRVRAIGKSLDLETHYHFPLPETIITDPSRLRQILINLIGNAIKFTNEGKVTLDIVLRRNGSDACLEYQIHDTGIGISKEQMQIIFDPFTQADASISRSFGGTGLGLVISQKFAKLLGGQIEVESVPGEGSTFTLSIPAIITEKTHWVHSIDKIFNRRNKQKQKTGTITELPDLSEKRILLAEDGLDNQRLFSILLKKMNVELTIANTGKEAVELALHSHEEKRPFDLILMDMQMPVMDGCEAIKTLRRMGWHGRIIALTANAMAVDRERCLQFGADDFISKPVNASVFLEQIAAAITPTKAFKEAVMP